MAKGAGVEVKHVQNSSSKSLRRFGTGAAWSLCIDTLHVSTKTSEQNAHLPVSQQRYSLRVSKAPEMKLPG